MPATQEEKIPKPGDLVRLSPLHLDGPSLSAQRYYGLGLYLRYEHPGYAIVYWFRLHEIAGVHSSRVILEQ